MKLTVTDTKGNGAGEIEVGFELIENRRGTQAVHDAVTAHRANRRSGTASTKTVGEVAGSNRKPWRQKGTGRARAGSFRSPLWAGGGVVFGPKPRDFGKKLNRSTRSLALRKALSERLKAGDVLVVDQIPLDAPKTRAFTAVLAALQIKGTALIVGVGDEANLRLAIRNVPDVELTTGSQLSTYQVLRYDKILFTRPAFQQVEQRLK